MYWITENIGISGFFDKSLNPPVSAILNLIPEIDYKDQIPDSIEYKYMPFDDVYPFVFPFAGMKERTDWITEKIKEGKKVLVNCAEGNSRAVHTVSCYLITTGKEVSDVIELIISKKKFSTVFGKEVDQLLSERINKEYLTRWEGWYGLMHKE